MKIKDLVWDFFKNINFSDIDYSSYKNMQKVFKGKFDIYKKLFLQNDRDKFEKIFDIELKDIDKYELLKTISQIYFLHKDYKNSINIDKILLDNTQDSIEYLTLLYNLSSKYYLLYELDKTRKILSSCINMLQEKNFDLKDIKTFRLVLRVYILYIAASIEENKDLDRLYGITQKLLVLLNSGKNIFRNSEELKYFLIQVYVQISSIQIEMEDYIGALEYGIESLKIIQDKRVYITPEVYWGVYYNLSYCYKEIGDIKKAKTYALKAKEYSERLNKDDFRIKRIKEFLDSLEEIYQSEDINEVVAV